MDGVGRRKNQKNLLHVMFQFASISRNLHSIGETLIPFEEWSRVVAAMGIEIGKNFLLERCSGTFDVPLFELDDWHSSHKGDEQR